MSKHIVSVIFGIIIGLFIGHDMGFQKCWDQQEKELTDNHATVYERWLVGHEKKQD